jgi:hypothetical protein
MFYQNGSNQFVIARGTTTVYAPFVIPSMIMMLKPAILSHKTPKKAVIILHWLYIALTRKKNKSEVAGMAISANIPSTYWSAPQLSIGATITPCQSVNHTIRDAVTSNSGGKTREKSAESSGVDSEDEQRKIILW